MDVSWTLKKDECQRIDAFQLWGWKLLRVPWTARRSNQSILKEISPEYSLEGLMLKLKLKLQYFGHLMQRANSLEKNPDAGKDWRQEKKGMTGRDGWMASLTQWTWVWAGSGIWWRTGKPGVLQSMGSQRIRHDWAAEQQQQQHLNQISRLSKAITFLMCVDLSQWAEDLLLDCFERGPQAFPAFGFKLKTETWALLGSPACQRQILELLSLHNHMSQFLTMNFFVGVCVVCIYLYVYIFRYTSEILQVWLQTTTIKQILQ